jgi:hypothetical protein
MITYNYRFKLSPEAAVTALVNGFRSEEMYTLINIGAVVTVKNGHFTRLEGEEQEMIPVVRFARYAQYFRSMTASFKANRLKNIEGAVSEEILNLFKDEERLYLVIAALAFGIKDERNLRAASKLGVRIIYNGPRPDFFEQAVEVISLAAKFGCDIKEALETYKQSAA